MPPVASFKSVRAAVANLSLLSSPWVGYALELSLSLSLSQVLSSLY